MLIDETYFERMILIPNVAEPEPNNRTAAVLGELIEVCEDEVLSYAFGYPMWIDFKTAYNADPLTISPEYKEILEGKTYVVDGETFHFVGLLRTDLKKSLLADYVYYRYQTENVTQQTEFGQVAADVKIGNKASSTPKITEAWNSFVMQLQGESAIGVSGFTQEGNPYRIISNRLGNGLGVSYYNGNAKGGEVSLMKFLSDNKANYPLLQESDNINFGLQLKNSFGI